MARHQQDLVLCRQQPGVAPGYLCNACDGRCPICDSHANQELLVHVCDECAFRQHAERKEGRCVICSNRASNPAYYCHQCVLLERDRDGCPKVKNLSIQKRDYHHTAKTFQASAS